MTVKQNIIQASEPRSKKDPGWQLRNGVWKPEMHYKDVRVVILGVKPYGVGPKEKVPSSLGEFIYRWDQDCGYRRRNYDLRSWKRSGILMLPFIEKATTEVICKLSNLRRRLLFILWNKRAEKYWKLIDTKKHYIRVKKSENIFLPVTSWRID